MRSDVRKKLHLQSEAISNLEDKLIEAEAQNKRHVTSMKEKEEELRSEKSDKEKLEEKIKEVESEIRLMDATIHRREREKEDLIAEKTG